jgi:phosphoglycolate phosphatase
VFGDLKAELYQRAAPSQFAGDTERRYYQLFVLHYVKQSSAPHAFMIQAIFFDFNGVIIDDEPIQLIAHREALSAEGIALTDDDYYGSLGMDDVTFVRAAFARASTPLKEETLNALIERKTDLHRKAIEAELPLFPGVETFLRAASRTYDLGLVSMARRIEIDQVLARARLDETFAVTVSAEDVNACKPDPCSYQRALELLNERRRAQRKLPLLGNECLVVEDSPPGILAGRAAGMRSLGVTNTVNESALRAAGAEVVTQSLADWTVDAVHHLYG